MAPKAQSQRLVGTDELIARYRATCGLSEGASYGYAKVAERFCAFLDDNGLSLEDVDQDTVVAYANFVDRGQNLPGKRNLSCSIRHFFRWLEAEGMIEDAARRVGAKGKHGKHSRSAERRRPSNTPSAHTASIVKAGGKPARPLPSSGIIDETLIESFVICREAKNPGSKQATFGIKALGRYLEDVGTPFEEVTADTLEDFSAWVRTAYSEYTWRNFVTELRSFYSWLEENGYYENVAKTFSMRGRGHLHRGRTPLSLEQARRVLEAAGDQANPAVALRDKMIVSMMVVCAIRPGELQAANVSDISFVGNSAIFSIHGARGKSDSLVFLPPCVAEDARRYLDYRQAGPEEPLVASAANYCYGKRITSSSIDFALRRVFDAAGIEGKAGGYSLQQTALELAMEEGYAGAQLRSLARVGSFASLQRLDYERSLAGSPPQVRVEALLNDVGGDARHFVTTAGKLRSMLGGMDDGAEVVVSLDRAGRFSVEPVVKAGSDV